MLKMLRNTLKMLEDRKELGKLTGWFHWNNLTFSAKSGLPNSSYLSSLICLIIIMKCEFTSV